MTQGYFYGLFLIFVSHLAWSSDLEDVAREQARANNEYYKKLSRGNYSEKAKTELRDSLLGSVEMKHHRAIEAALEESLAAQGLKPGIVKQDREISSEDNDELKEEASSQVPLEPTVYQAPSKKSDFSPEDDPKVEISKDGMSEEINFYSRSKNKPSKKNKK